MDGGEPGFQQLRALQPNLPFSNTLTGPRRQRLPLAVLVGVSDDVVEVPGGRGSKAAHQRAVLQVRATGQEGG
jgi:hypothetical protein